MIFGNLNFNNKTILITGGAGFIGSNLAMYFQKNFPKSNVIIFDLFRNNSYLENGNLLSFGHFNNIAKFNGEVICGNIADSKDLTLLSKYKFDFIFHQAAISDTRVYDQELVMKTNVNSFYELLEITKSNRATMVYASSAATYGSIPSPQVVGNEKPDNPYGYSKLMMDRIAQNFLQQNPEIKIIGLRFFNVYGQNEFYKNKTASMVIQLGHQILNGNPPRLFKDSDTIMRDFIYIQDVIQANILACQAKLNGTYNVGTGIPRSFQDVADILQSELGTDLGTEYFENPYNDYQMHTQANIQSTIENLNFQPKFSLEEGIRAYIPQIKLLHSSLVS